MKLHSLCAGLVLSAVLLAAGGCACCHKHCCPAPAVSSAPPCCPAPAPCCGVPAPAPCCGGAAAPGVVPVPPVGTVSGAPFTPPVGAIH
jgi:hypothetical protein